MTPKKPASRAKTAASGKPAAKPAVKAVAKAPPKPASKAAPKAAAARKPARAVASAVKTATAVLRPGRLVGKVAIVTGAAGGIGQVIARRYLEEGAKVVLTGRNRDKLDALRDTLLAATGAPAANAMTLAFDAADPGQARFGVEAVVREFGRIDILVNNAGSAGPKQPIIEQPLTREELEAQRAAGSADTETVRDAAGNLLGLAWNMVRAAAPHLGRGSSVINVSTIFSRTKYYGRSAYVMPKAALNALSKHLALQLGAKGIRVNTVYPGPIEGPRIRNVFSAMDTVRNTPQGTTANDFLSVMALSRRDEASGEDYTFPTIDDVANSIVFLGSDESRAFSAQGFEVTNGMQVPHESRSTWASRPELRTVDGTGSTVLVAAGDQVADALAIARAQAGCGARVILGLGSEESVEAARAALRDDDTDRRIRPELFDRRRPETLAQAVEAITRGDLLHGAVVLPAFGTWRFHTPLAEASDADVDAFLGAELTGALAVARALSRLWLTRSQPGDRLRVMFMSNGSDGTGNVYADILRAGVEQLLRVWRATAPRSRRARRAAAARRRPGPTRSCAGATRRTTASRSPPTRRRACCSPSDACRR